MFDLGLGGVNFEVGDEISVVWLKIWSAPD